MNMLAHLSLEERSHSRLQIFTNAPAHPQDCTLLNLRHVVSKTFPVLPKTATESSTTQMSLYAACNTSIVAIHALGKSDPECGTLVQMFLRRDFLAAIPSSLAYYCQSQCMKRLVPAIERAVTTCGEKLKEMDEQQHPLMWKRLFKKLLMVSAAKYYASIACYSNHLGIGCLGVHPHNIITREDCPMLSTTRRTLQSPFFDANMSASCTRRCLERLNQYVYQGGCCVRTVEEASQQFWQDLGLLSPLSLDVGDRSNVFETAFLSSKDPVTFLTPAKCPPLPESGMTTDCLLRMPCNRFNWPFSKCCDITCERGM
jgi:hypothetical protein